MDNSFSADLGGSLGLHETSACAQTVKPASEIRCYGKCVTGGDEVVIGLTDDLVFFTHFMMPVNVDYKMPGL